jgi:hypothetical protein
MLDHRMLAKRHGQAISVIVLEIPQSRPEQKARHAFEIAELFERYWSGREASNVRRFGSGFPVRRGAAHDRRLVKPKEKNARYESHDEDSADNGVG